MLASPTSPTANRAGTNFRDLIATGDWVADLKMDGVRALAHWSGDDLQITNRVGVDIGYRYPEIMSALTDVLTGTPAILIDAEIVARDGKFETTLIRDQQQNAGRIRALSESSPCSFIAFDAPDFKTPWVDRRLKLEAAADWTGGNTLALTVISRDDGFLDKTRERGMEGVVAKHVSGRYEFGKRSRLWLKFKNTYRVTCLVAGYTKGTGSRERFGAMELALLDDTGTPVSVGRVGTGFDEAEITRLKQALDSGGLLTVEIETTNQTSQGQLRFPVYRGVRSDVAPSDCLLAQLQFLPTC